MKKGNNVLTGILIAVFVAIIMVVSLVLGYRFLKTVNKDAAEKIDDTVQNAKDMAEETLATPPYSGPRLYENRGYIFNDAGDILSDFHVIRSNGLDIVFDADRKYGVLINNKKCYLIGADLKYEQLADKCSTATISFDGTQVFYGTASDGIWLYNTQTGKKTQISKTGNNLCISPGGKSVAYCNDSDRHEITIIAGAEKKKKISALQSETGIFYPVAISDDGKVMFYQMTVGTENSFMCHIGGKEIKLATKEGRDMYFDRSCKKVIYKGRHGVYYFDTDWEEPVQLVAVNEFSNTIIIDTAVSYTGSIWRGSIVDTYNLSDVTAIETMSGVYCLSDDCLSTVQLMEEGTLDECAVTEDGIACAYKLDDCVYISRYENGSIDKTLLFEDASGLDTRIYLHKFSDGFVKKFDYSAKGSVYKLYYFRAGEERQFITNCGSGSDGTLQWNEVFRKCYFIADGKLVRISDDDFEEKIIAEDVAASTLYPSGYEAVEYTDNEGNRFVVIDDKVLPE
ncbi:TolB family protein [Butyrivibrio sp. VCB2001]|uniref:TolB family protein n=1 Tax=Butyrivibrio sp. VCB2001 TaxID=1280667 RepID=UPI0003FE7218|nr:hypothetical protein [Butyrivibrio sp. VCB2001]